MSVIHAFNGLQQYELLERSGILNLDDKKYQDEIKTITKTFLSATAGYDIDNMSEVNIDWFGYPYDGMYYLLQFKNMCNINNIQLLIKPTNNPNDIMNVLLANDAAVNHGYFKIQNNRIDICTIVLVYHTKYIHNIDYKSLIQHELKHAYDILMEYHGSNEQMNKDIITKEFFFDTKITDIVDPNIFGDNEYSIPLWKLKKINQQYKEKYYNDYRVTFALLSDMLYYMNKSEVSARLIQFKCSEDYEESIYLYDEYNTLCDNIINYASDRVKNFINDIIHSADYENIYHIKFNGGAIANTNKLFKFYKKRIKHFIMHCRNLLKESHSFSYYFIPNGAPRWIRDLEIK